MIRLAPITPENYRECLRLQVAESQARFVASNAKSLAEAYAYYDTSQPYAIYDDEQMVGFLLLRRLRRNLRRNVLLARAIPHRHTRFRVVASDRERRLRTSQESVGQVDRED